MLINNEWTALTNVVEGIAAFGSCTGVAACPRAPEELARVRLSGKPRGGTPPQIVNRNITSEYRDKMFLDHEISFLQRPLQHFKTTLGQALLRPFFSTTCLGPD